MASVMKYPGKCTDITTQEYFSISHYEKGNHIFLAPESIGLSFALADNCEQHGMSYILTKTLNCQGEILDQEQYVG